MTSPMRLRDSENTPRLLRLALDAPDDEPTEVELRSLAVGLGVGAIGSLPIPVPHVETGALGSVAAKAATLGGSKIFALVIGPALIGAAAGTAVLTTSVSMQPRPARDVPAAVATVDLQPQPEPVHHDEVQPVAPPTIPTLEPVAASAPRPAPPSTTPTARAQPIAAPDPVSPPATSPESEVEFLERAKGLVAGDPNRAFAVASEHASRFPKGMLQQESEVIAIEALARAGRMAAASERLAHFRQRFPASAYLPHLVTVVHFPQ